MNLANKIFFAFGVVALAGCQRELGPAEYMAWVSDKENGLISEQSAGGYNFYLQYKPIEFVAIKEAGETANSEAFNEVLKEFEGAEYYTLRIETADRATDILKKNIESQEEYFYRLEYFTTFIQNDLKLVCGGDTSPCILAHFERSYQMTPFSNILLAFEQPDAAHSGQPDADRTLIYNDKVLDAGVVHLTISGQAIQHTPKLKTL